MESAKQFSILKVESSFDFLNKNYKNQTLILSTPVFDFFNAIYVKDFQRVGTVQTFNKVENEVFMLKPKFIDTLSYNEKILDEIELEKFQHLQRREFIYDKNEKSLFIVYNKQNFRNFNFEDFLEKHKKSNLKILKLAIFRDLCEQVQQLHQKSRKLCLIHPALIVQDSESGNYSFAETSLDLFLQNFQIEENFQIGNALGYFSLEQIPTIETDSYSLKTDIVLLSILLVYFFSTKTGHSENEDERLTFSFEKIMYEIQRDFLIQNNTFSNCLNHVKYEKSIFKFLQNQINLDYKLVASLEDFISSFDKLLNEEIKLELCNECKKENAFTINKICGDLLCENCNEEHSKCKKLNDFKNEKISLKVSTLVKQISNIKEKVDNMPVLESKQISEVYKKSLQKMFESILNEQQKIEDLVILEEEKLNKLLIFLDSQLTNKSVDNFNSIEQKLIELKQKLDVISHQIHSFHQEENENLENSIRNKNKKRTTQMKFFERKIEKKNSEKIEDLIIQRENFIKENEDILKSIEEYKTFIRSTSNLKSMINFNMNIATIIELINSKSTNYTENLQQFLDQEFSNNHTKVYEELSELLKSSEEFPKNSLIFENEFATTETLYVATFDANQNEILILTSDEIYKFSFPASDYRPEKKIEIISLHEHMRTLNLKTRVFCTGGVNEVDKISKLAFSVNYMDSDGKFSLHLEVLPEMLHARHCHTMAKVNDFYVYCLGGKDTKSCEMFNFINNQWASLPSLNICRYNSSCFVYNEIYLYIFFGKIGERSSSVSSKYADSIEVLNLGKPNEWNIISFDNGGREFSLNGIVPSENKEEITIFGGIKGEDKASLDFYNYNFEYKNLSKIEKYLEEEYIFYDCNLLTSDKKEYIGFADVPKDKNKKAIVRININ